MAAELELYNDEEPILPVNPRSCLTYVQQICLQENGCCESCPENLLESIPCQVKYSNGVRETLGLEKQISPFYKMVAAEKAAALKAPKKKYPSKRKTVSFAAPKGPLTLFAETLLKARLDRRLTVSELALKAKVDPEHVTKLERGLINPGIQEAMDLAVALGCDPIEFIRALT